MDICHKDFWKRAHYSHGDWGESFACSYIFYNRAYYFRPYWWRSFLDMKISNALNFHQECTCFTLQEQNCKQCLQPDLLVQGGLRHQRGCPGKFCQDFLCCWGSLLHQAGKQRSQSLLLPFSGSPRPWGSQLIARIGKTPPLKLDVAGWGRSDWTD